MKSTKVFGIVLGVVVMVFVVAPVASAQTSWAILDDAWFMVKLSLKGYLVDTDDETIVGKGSGGNSAYLLMISGADNYTLTTCMEDDNNTGNWIKGTTSGGPIGIGSIYGATYPELWDFAGNALEFHNGDANFSFYPTLYIKVTPDGTTLKKAKISTVYCGLYAEFVSGENAGRSAFGSCKISGSTIPMAKVPPGCL
jgi:hypothetical protein